MAKRHVASVVSAELALAHAVNERLLLAGWREHEAADTARQDASVKEHRSLHDDLTGLPNRTLFGDLLQQAMASAHSAGSMVAVLVLDLNGFKLVNDRLGHAAGDHVLQQVADRLRHAVRAADTAARLGGDEFAILLATTDGAPQAVRAAVRVLRALAAPYTLYGAEQQLTASIGIALSPLHGTEARRLLEQADIALYAAKRSGAGYALASVDRDSEGPLSVPELRAVNEQLFIAGLREQEMVEQCGRAEGVARESSERWQFALAAGSLGSWDLDLTTLALKGSETYHRTIGLPPETNLTYMRLLERIHPDDRLGMQAAQERAIATHTDYADDYRVVHPDGSVHWIVARGRPYYADDGSPQRILGTTQDVTERQQQEAAVGQRYEDEQRLRSQVEQMGAEREAMLAHVAEGIVLANADGRVTFLNAAARDLLGVTAMPQVGDDAPSAGQLIATDAEPCHAEQAVLTRAAQGETVSLARRRSQRQDGRNLVTEGEATPIFAADGARLGAVLTLHDVTAEVELERPSALVNIR